MRRHRRSFECVARAIDIDLPAETAFLCRYNSFKAQVKGINMPDRVLDRLYRFLRQDGGQAAERAREKEFAALTDDVAARIEAIYADL